MNTKSVYSTILDRQLDTVNNHVVSFQVGLSVKNPAAERALCLAVVHFHVLGETVQEVEGFATNCTAVLWGLLLLPRLRALLPG